MPTPYAPSGSSILVNASTTGDQSNGRATSFASGGFIVVWQDFVDYSTGPTVYLRAQRFDDAGQKVGGEITLSTYAPFSTAPVLPPAIFTFADGRFLVSWEKSGAPGDSSSTGTVAQLFAADGSPLAGEFRVSNNTAGYQSRPSIAELSDGSFVLVFDDGGGDGFGQSVQGQLFNSSGAPIGSNFVVNTTIANIQNQVSVAALDSGGFVVTWTDGSFTPPDTTAAIRAQVFDASGTKLGSEILVNSHFPDNQAASDVASNGTGFVVTWFSPSGPDDLSGSSIRAQRFDSAGNKLGAEFLVNSVTEGNQAGPTIVELPGGGFMISWITGGPLGSPATSADLRAQVFDSAGNRVGGEFSIVQPTDGQQSVSYLFHLASGEPALVYTDRSGIGDPSGSGIRLQLLAPLGSAGEIVGTEGDDYIVGGGGDILRGLGGDDVYIVSAGDEVVEALNGGSDRVETALAAYALAANVEDLTGLAATGQRLHGNELGNRIVGNSGNDNLAGMAGNDTLIGGAGSDILDGGAGFDRLEGGTGVDIYYVDAGDMVVEDAADGAIDYVRARTSYGLTAGSHVEVLTTADYRLTTRIDLTGNEFNNSITGSNGVNSLNGGGGDDTLRALDGDDMLDGGIGRDLLVGGTGNDIYFVDADDRVEERAGEGFDQVRARTSFTLTAGSHVEVLTTADYRLTTRIDLSGNEFNNSMTGSNGVNSLRGGGGDDTLRGLEGDDMLDGGTGRDLLYGGIGNDIYYVDADDSVHEAVNEGVDYVWARTSFTLSAGSAVEVLGTSDFRLTARIDLTGNEFNNSITGNNGINHLGGGGGGDTLRGLDGNDVLDGGTGGDLLFGGNGNDSFAFTTALGNGNVDTIADFGIGDDQILLSGGAGQPFAGLGEGALEAGSFVIGTRAADADDRIIYNSQTGQLFYDADGSGSGAAIWFATLTSGTPLSAADFLVI